VGVLVGIVLVGLTSISSCIFHLTSHKSIAMTYCSRCQVEYAPLSSLQLATPLMAEFMGLLVAHVPPGTVGQLDPFKAPFDKYTGLPPSFGFCHSAVSGSPVLVERCTGPCTRSDLPVFQHVCDILFVLCLSAQVQYVELVIAMLSRAHQQKHYKPVQQQQQQQPLPHQR
jgi:hypothetical protein